MVLHVTGAWKLGSYRDDKVRRPQGAKGDRHNHYYLTEGERKNGTSMKKKEIEIRFRT